MGRWVIRQPDGRVTVWRLVLAVGIVAVAGVLLLALWTRPPDWLEPAHQHLVGAAGWMREHWLNAVAITAWGTIFLAAVAVVPLVSRRPRPGGEPGSDRLSRERAVMLRQVRYKWIAGVLEPSLADAARMALGLKPYPDVLDLGTRVLRRVGQPPESFPEETTIGTLFEQVGSGLLIIGRPGAGKTTLLLQLADELLARAENNPDQPIPAVFHLSSWAADPRPLEEWLTRELTVNYDVPADTAAAWLKHGALTLLFDGLDEVSATRRAACGQAINDYRHDHGLVPIAVCSRTEELEQLAVRLRLHEAVELQPPTNAEIDRYLSYLEATGTPLTDIRAALTTDDSLRELLRSPLMLHVIALAYHGRTASALETPGTSENRREQLWRAYTVRMFEQRPLGADCRYTPAQAIKWLRWLAQGLYYRDEAEFNLFEIDINWLPPNITRSRRGLLSKHGESGTETTDTAEDTETRDLVGGPYIWPVLWLTELVRRSISYVVLLWVVGVTIATALHRGPVTELAVGLVCCLGTVMCAEILRVLFRRMRDRHWGGRPASPNERIWRPVRDACVGGTLGALYLGSLYGSALGIVYGPWTGWVTALVTAAVAGTAAWIGIGGAIFLHHFAVRAELTRADAAPWRLYSFLEAMTERQLLRRSGGAYLFVHRMLRDFLATADPDGPRHADIGMPPEPSIGDAAAQ